LEITRPQYRTFRLPCIAIQNDTAASDDGDSDGGGGGVDELVPTSVAAPSLSSSHATVVARNR
jgi:hypothetical protein